MEIKVKCYSGYKCGETPRAVIIEEKEYLIKEIIRRERIEDINSKEREEIYWCRLENNKTIKLIKSLETGQWRLKNE